MKYSAFHTQLARLCIAPPPPAVVPAGDLADHGQDRGHLPPRRGADREERAAGRRRHRGGARGAAALLPGGLRTGRAILQEAHPATRKTSSNASDGKVQEAKNGQIKCWKIIFFILGAGA